MRKATLDDLPALKSLVNAARPSSSLFSSPGSEALVPQLKWLLGDRDSTFSASPVYAQAAPFFVLEKKYDKHAGQDDGVRIVAAAGAQHAPTSTLTIHPLLWDGKESAADVVEALLASLVETIAEINNDVSKLVLLPPRYAIQS
jgi:hypothetical protein